MTIATLQFNLSDEYDAEEFEVARKAKDLWLALFSIHKEIFDDLPEVDRDHFWEILEEYGITLEELS